MNETRLTRMLRSSWEPVLRPSSSYAMKVCVCVCFTVLHMNLFTDIIGNVKYAFRSCPFCLALCSILHYAEDFIFQTQLSNVLTLKASTRSWEEIGFVCTFWRCTKTREFVFNKWMCSCCHHSGEAGDISPDKGAQRRGAGPHWNVSERWVRPTHFSSDSTCLIACPLWSVLYASICLPFGHLLARGVVFMSPAGWLHCCQHELLYTCCIPEITEPIF